MKKLFAFFIFTFLSFIAFSSSKTFNYKNYTVTAFYSPSVQPGDAVFIRLVFESKNKKFINSLPESGESGKLSIFQLKEDGTLSEKTISGTQIRQYIIDDIEWKRYVPSYVYNYVNQNKLYEIIKHGRSQ